MTDCRGNAWHDQWVQMASGLAGGKTYRIHTFSTDPSSPTDQRSTTALNNFAFYAQASGGTPQVYGIGAMEAYFRLPQNQTSDFYMAQVEAVHAGKTMMIELWDPGDTGGLPATLQVSSRRPRATARDVQLHRHPGQQQRGCLQQPDRHQRDLGGHQHGWLVTLQRLLAHHHHPAAGELLRAAAVHRHHRERAAGGRCATSWAPGRATRPT